MKVELENLTAEIDVTQSADGFTRRDVPLIWSCWIYKYSGVTEVLPS